MLGRTISLPAFAMGMGDDTRGMSITGEGNSGATGLSARVKLVRIEYVARSSSLEPSARATWGISGLRGIVGCRTTFGTSVCVRRASVGLCSVGDGIGTVWARTSSPSFGLVIVNALNPTTLAVLRRVAEMDRRMRRGEFLPSIDWLGMSADEKVVGLVGMGNIAREYAWKMSVRSDSCSFCILFY